MRIAISTDSGMVSAHFGRCPEFTIVDIEDKKIVKKEVIPNPGHATGLIPKFLHNKGVNCMICGGMGWRAEDFFKEFGIETIVGIEGKVDYVIEQFRKGELKSGESMCQPGEGEGYGLDKEDGHNH